MFEGDYYLNYEGNRINFSIPDSWRVISNRDIPSPPGVKNPKGEIEKALDDPIGSPPIERMARPGMEVVILFDDMQRPTPAHLAVPSILNRLNKAGIPDEKIKAVCALGTHPIHTIEQMEKKIGEEATRRLKGRIFSHDPHSDENIIIGRTHWGTLVEINPHVVSSDLVIGVGECMPHPSAGFGGGCKIIMPGVSSYRSVASHHFTWIRHKDTRVNVLEGNHFYEDIVDAARLARLAFKLDFVMNEKREVVGAFAGSPVYAHREASRYASRLYLVKLPRLADITITSASPLEIGVQVTKALIMASYSTRFKGTIIWVASQKQAGPILPLIEEMAKKETSNEVHKRLFGGHIPEHLKSFGISYIMQIVLFKRLGERFDVIHVTEGLSKKQVEMMGFTYAPNIEVAIEMAYAKMKTADVAIFPSGGNTIPEVV
ncbi:MAG: nickel-dependent lactate racemase [Syntrophorhabdaceae bacterium]|nr:nickel-dependent lactate racemase [Syntrophorhabdaceae bacterium]